LPETHRDPVITGGFNLAILRESGFQHRIATSMTSIVYYQQQKRHTDNIYSSQFWGYVLFWVMSLLMFDSYGSIIAVIIAPNMNPHQNPSSKNQTSFDLVQFCTSLRSVGQQQQQSSLKS